MPVKDSGMWRNKSPMSKEYRKGGKLYMGGGGTETGKEAKSYKEYVKRMFGGGLSKFRPSAKPSTSLSELTQRFNKSRLSAKPAPRVPRSAGLSRPPGVGMRHGNRKR
jgi:hypothetical protein